jgi:hypothetical protein
MSDQRIEGGWQALGGAPHGIPPICAACGEVDDRGVSYEGGDTWLFLCHDCTRDIVTTYVGAQAEQEGGR